MPGSSLGHPGLHKVIAQVFWGEGNYEQARHHFLLSRDGNLCGRILIKMHKTKGYENELDLFIVQAVLQLLCLKDRKTAEDTFISYTSNHSSIRRKEAPFKQPLLNFVYFLLRCIDTGRGDSFRSLWDLYKPSLIKDPVLEKYLFKIGIQFFGVAPLPIIPGGGLMGGMFGDLFTRLLQGFDGNDDDDSQHGQQSRSSTNTRLRPGGAANSVNLD